MKPQTFGPALALIVAGFVIIAQAAYVVDETEQVIITQFGEPMGEAIREPGLKFRVPFVQQVNRFDKRLMEWGGSPERMPTKDKKYLWLDSTARWRIVDPLKFLQTVGTENGAQTRLDDILDGATRTAVARHDLISIVRSTNRILNAEIADDVDFQQDLSEIDVGRDAIIEEIVKRAAPVVNQFGIELVDLRIKRINYEAEVRSKVFERMISERKRVAEKLRSEGRGESAEIQGEKEKELNKIRSEAYKRAEILKGEADATAVKIYADAYGKDPEFYQFYRTLESYDEAIRESDTLVLTTDNEFLHYLKQSK